MYWLRNVGGTDIRLSRANLDGSNVEDIVENQNILPGPFGVAVDSNNQKLYMSDNLQQVITQSDLNGLNRTNIMSKSMGSSARGIALDTINDRIYITDITDSGIVRLSTCPDEQTAIALDTLVAGVHFDNRASPDDIGYKALAVNLSDLNQFEDGSIVDAEILRNAGLTNGPSSGVKILGNGELTKKLTVSAHAFSASAKSKIEELGGTCEVIVSRKSRTEKS